MKIVFLIRSLEVGGAERQLIYLARGLSQGGVSVTIGVFYGGGNLEQMLNNADVPIRYLNKKSRWDVIGFFRRTVKWLRHESPDVLHSYLTGANIVSVILKPFIPKMTIVWGIRASNMRLENYDWLARATFRLSVTLSHYVDLIIVNSTRGYDFHLAQGYPSHRMTIIPNGIDIEVFSPNDDIFNIQRQKWGISNEKNLVGIVGRIDPMKDHKTFLKAAKIVLAERKDVIFVCVGDGDSKYVKELKQFSISLGIGNFVMWKPGVNKVEHVYNTLDLLVSTSAYGEGFSNTLAEAMACGVPCVATNVGDAQIILSDIGMIVPPRDSTLIAKSIIACIDRDDIEKNIIKNKSIEHISNNYSIDSLITKTSKALKL